MNLANLLQTNISILKLYLSYLKENTKRELDAKNQKEFLIITDVLKLDQGDELLKKNC